MSAELRFTLNGRAVVVRDVDPHTTLLQYLREHGLTGSKEGCAEGECGACAVVVVQREPDGSAHYEAVNACLLLLPMLHGVDVWTVEGIGRSECLHPVQQALASGGGSQCGYCTPGFVMSLFAHYHRSPRGDVEQALGGNLCRCTGYRPIREAARALPQVASDDAFVQRLLAPAPVREALHYDTQHVGFVRPLTLPDALGERAAHPEAQIIAGGTDLVVEINQTQLRHTRFLSLEAVPELKRFEESADRWMLGAGLTFGELEARLHGRVPLLAQLLPLFASQLIRARATLGGNLVTASPVGDAAPVLLALDAQIELQSVRGVRELALSDFFTGYRQTALGPDELLTSVSLATAQPTLARFYKVSKRVLDDISCVSAAFALTIEQGLVTRARLAFGGVAATPVRAYAAEASLVGAPWDRAALERAQAELRQTFTPISDVRGSAAYRSALLESLLEKFLCEVTP